MQLKFSLLQPKIAADATDVGGTQPEKHAIFLSEGGKNMNIADRLKELRKNAGYSQEQLAEMLDISRQAVSKWESGQGNPDIENVIRLTEIYGVSADYILLGHEKKECLEVPEPKENFKKEIDPETKKTARIIAVIIVSALAVALSGALFIAALSLINRYIP